jgi:prepilin-type processing-associated H-X9-DG protein
LPYLGAKELFSQYRRDEPWDSPANKAALARMPRVFAAPGDVRAADGLTHYQVLVGPGTAFERPDLRVRFTDFPRGASETILVMEAANAVPWTKPQDLPQGPDGPLPKVGGLVGNGFHALFADGSVRWIEAEKQENELRTRPPKWPLRNVRVPRSGPRAAWPIVQRR